MTAKKKTDEADKDAESEPATNYLDQPANHDSSVRDATDDEKPDPTSIVQVEELQDDQK